MIDLFAFAKKNIMQLRNIEKIRSPEISFRYFEINQASQNEFFFLRLV